MVCFHSNRSPNEDITRCPVLRLTNEHLPQGGQWEKLELRRKRADTKTFLSFSEIETPGPRFMKIKKTNKDEIHTLLRLE